ncbi:hypothetical protein BH23ACT8_BH23ACT8_07790 [soil metagenome]
MRTIATIDDLMSKVDSKYTLVHLSARRAREINAYYHSLGEGLGQYTPPLVDQVDSNKPLSIALEEIAAAKIVPQYPGDAERVAADLLGSDAAVLGEVETGDTEPSEAQVVPLEVGDALAAADADVARDHGPAADAHEVAKAEAGDPSPSEHDEA